jgi:hypothetical protein
VPRVGKKLGVLGLVVVALIGGTALASGKAPPLTRSQIRGCLGMGTRVSHFAKVAPADPSVISEFQAFTATSAKPLQLNGMSALGGFGVATYDPAHIVDLANSAPGWRLALLPVGMAPPASSPRYCARIPGWRAAEQLSIGKSGPGVCVVAVVAGTTSPQGALCESLPMLNSYFGPLNLVEWGDDLRAVTFAPDGVRAVRYTFSNGKTTTVRVRNNLFATPLFALPGYGPGIPDRFRLRVFRKWFPRMYPIEVTLVGPAGSTVREWHRPADLFRELAGFNRLQLDDWNLTPPSQRPN